MKFIVQYIPLDKIKSGPQAPITDRIRKLRTMMLDCMHVLIVRRNRKDGSYVIISGRDRYEFLKQHTKKRVAPCLVDERKPSADLKLWLFRLRYKRLLPYFPHIRPEHLTPASGAIIRSFLKQESRFSSLSRSQQLKVLLLAIRYKQATVKLMKKKVDDLLLQTK